MGETTVNKIWNIKTMHYRGLPFNLFTVYTESFIKH